MAPRRRTPLWRQQAACRHVVRATPAYPHDEKVWSITQTSPFGLWLPQAGLDITLCAGMAHAHEQLPFIQLLVTPKASY